MYKFLLTLVFLPQLLCAQSDSIMQLTDVYTLILKSNPVALQANINTKIAAANLLSKRGFFDPKVSVDFDKKVYQDKTYYSLLNSELKIPTWLGIDFKVAYQQNTGYFLNPENTVPDNGLMSAGFSFPVGQGMWTDMRRLSVNQAKAIQQMTLAQQVLQVNDLLLSAADDYYQWQFNYYNYQQLNEGYQLAKSRLVFVTSRVLDGDLAAIDSIEATIEVQQRFVQVTQAATDYLNSTITLSNYLWQNDTPMFIAPAVIPPVPNIDSIEFILPLIDSLVYTASTQHPKLTYTQSKIKQLEFEKTYKSNLLMPNLKINYNFINEAGTVNEISNDDFNSNYKIGLGFEYPLFLRKERGEIQMAKFKIADAKYDLTLQARELQNKIKTSGNDLTMLLNITNQQKAMVANYQIMRDGELERFKNGESSLLLINIRERSLIESKIKWYSLQCKTAFGKEKLLWNAGSLSVIE